MADKAHSISSKNPDLLFIDLQVDFKGPTGPPSLSDADVLAAAAKVLAALDPAYFTPISLLAPAEFKIRYH